MDVTGKELLKIADSEYLQEGTHQFVINNENLQAGIYFVEIKYSSQTDMLKYIVTK